MRKFSYLINYNLQNNSTTKFSGGTFTIKQYKKINSIERLNDVKDYIEDYLKEDLAGAKIYITSYQLIGSVADTKTKRAVMRKFYLSMFYFASALLLAVLLYFTL